ncbi:rhomboid family intramembrane serine protease [Labilibaculum sp. DW002]|uniref:Rhomboid family intramembrane serine protease n=1 Tax=Paralabilibaculum antarcticum TaxID=2912572 RepID=A0ABT5VSJ3_9BACT|nr:rhomboid family intramembrane serine protease [Labilibaculum sp. DW002]MDE5418400.1 rhomboid family intramembrane serine protease [Labilibaculum sp. DW002]
MSMNFNNPYQSYSHQSIWEGIKNSFKEGSTLSKLIYINLGVFLIVKIVGLFTYLFNLEISQVPFLVYWLSVPAETSALLGRPWTVFSYMFLHKGFLHILFNMLWLYWFGRIFLSFLDQKKLLSVYLIGGLTGAAVFIFAFNLFPVFENVLPIAVALGASASVMAVVFAAVSYSPNYIVNLVFLGPVKIKYIALFFVLTDIIQLPDGNAGGHLAHLGGAFYGWLFITQLRKGKDISSGFNQMMDTVFSWFKSKKKMKVTHKRSRTGDDKAYNKQKKQKQENLNEILEKISKSGYDSLSKEEKEILFKSSNQK